MRVTAESLAKYLVPGTDPDIAASYETLAERASTAVFGFEDEVAVVDIETTGYDCDRDHIIEVAAAILRGLFGNLHDGMQPGARARGCRRPRRLDRRSGHRRRRRGIRLQVANRHTGFLVNTPEGAAHRIRYLLYHRDRIRQMGETGREFVRENFLLTRHLRDGLTMILALRSGSSARTLYV